MSDLPRAERAFLCGVIEGFYGKPWTATQRATLFEWMEAWGMNTYVYAPKDDLKMRAAWRQPYDEAELAAMQALQSDCSDRRIDFVYTIAPGLDVRYADDSELRVLEQKLEQVLALGVRDFCVLFDDIPFRMSSEDEARFGSFAAAQAYLANEMVAFVRGRGADGLFLFCPTDYCGRMAKPTVAASAYLRELGERLHPVVDVFWTGPEIVSETIPAESIVELREVLGRRPLIWDNLHANDYDIRRVYLGPYDGRPDAMRAQVRGVITNPNNEFEANFIPIRSLALYASSERYDAAAAYDAMVAAWLSHFKTHGLEPITHEELALLVDVCSLPFRHGERGSQILATAKRMLASAAAEERGGAAPATDEGGGANLAAERYGDAGPVTEGDGDAARAAERDRNAASAAERDGDAASAAEGDGDPAPVTEAQGNVAAPSSARDHAKHIVPDADDDLDYLKQAAATMTRLFRKLTELDDRGLMYALYPYVWELRHELAYLSAYLSWVHVGRPGGRFGKPERLPNTYRQGLVATLEGLLPMDDSGALNPRG